MAVYDEDRKPSELTPQELAQREAELGQKYNQDSGLGGERRMNRDARRDSHRGLREASGRAEAKEDSALKDRVGNLFKGDKNDKQTEKPFNYRQERGRGKGRLKGKKKSLMNWVKKRRKQAAIISGLTGIVTIPILIITSFFGIFQLDFLLGNIDAKSFARFNASFSERSDKWFKSYIQLRLAEIDGDVSNNNNLLFRGNRVDTNNPVRDWYRTLRASNFEKSLLENNGIQFTSIAQKQPDGSLRFRSGKIQINKDVVDTGGFDEAFLRRVAAGDNGAINQLGDRFDDFVKLEVFENDKAARRNIKRVARDNTRFFQVLKRRHVRKDIANMTGVRNWQFFEKTRGKVRNKKVEFQTRLVRAVVPENSRAGEFLGCLLGTRAACPRSNDPNHKDNRSLDNGRRKSISPDGNDDDDASRRSPVAQRFKQLFRGFSGALLVLEVLDTVSSINSLFKEDGGGSSAIDKMVYAARMASIMTTYTTFAIMKDQIKSGDPATLDGGQVNQAMQYIKGFEQSDGYNYLVKSQASKSTVSAQEERIIRDCDPDRDTSTYNEGDYVPFCDDQKPSGGDGKGLSGFQDGWNRFVSNTPIGSLLDAYENIPGKFILDKVAGAISSVVSPIIDGIISLLGLEDNIEGITDYLGEKIGGFIGISPCIDGEESTGGVALNCLAAGAIGTAESSTRTSGGVASEPGTAIYNYNNQLAANYQGEQRAARGVFERYLSLENHESLASNIAFIASAQTSGGQAISTITGMVSAPFKQLGNFFANRPVFAQVGPSDTAEWAGVDRYDIPQACQNLDPMDPDYLQKATNAPPEVPREWEVIGDQAAFWDAVYEVIGQDDPSNKAPGIYNCLLLDQRVRGGIGNLYGYTDDGGYVPSEVRPPAETLTGAIGELQCPANATVTRVVGTTTYYQLPEAPNGEYSIYSVPSRRFGQKELICVLYTAAINYQKIYGDESKMDIGDLNAQGHASHKWGIGVDLDAAGSVRAADNTKPGYSPEATIELGKALLNTGLIKNIWYCGRGSTIGSQSSADGTLEAIRAYAESIGKPVNIKCLKGHYNHFHVDLTIPKGDLYTPA